MLNVNTLLMAKDHLCSYAPIYFLLKYNWQYLSDLIFLYILKWSLLVCYRSYYNITDCISSDVYGTFLYNCTCTSQAPLLILPAPNSSPHCNQKSLCKLSIWQLCQASWGRHRAGGSQAIPGLLWWDGWIRCRSRSGLSTCDIGASMARRWLEWAQARSVLEHTTLGCSGRLELEQLWKEEHFWGIPYWDCLLAGSLRWAQVTGVPEFISVPWPPWPNGWSWGGCWLGMPRVCRGGKLELV